MAGENRTTPADLMEAPQPNASNDSAPSAVPLELAAALTEAPWSFDFFQAVRRIEAAHASQHRIGTSGRPADDPVRFSQAPSLSFAPATVDGYVAGRGGGRPPRLSCSFFGLFGPNGPLPLHLTDYAYERGRFRHDPTFSRFLDVFHHRMFCYFYRAWARARPTVSFDRPGDDWFGRYLGSFFGIGMDTLRARDALPDQAKLFFAGLFSSGSRHPDGLIAIVGTFFGLEVSIREFIGEWIRLPHPARCRLGAGSETAILARTAVLGMCCWSVRHKFRLVLGPLHLCDFRRFLPGTVALARLTAIVRNYCGDELAWEANLVLRRQEVPALRLDGGAQLGWTAWLPSPELDRDPDDLVLTPLERAA